MSQYDDDVYNAKKNVTQIMMSLVSNEEKKHNWAVEQMPTALDHLYKMYESLTDCLVRQREERDLQIRRLMNELAEAKKDR